MRTPSTASSASWWDRIVSWFKGTCPVCGHLRWYCDGGWGGFDYCKVCGRCANDGWSEPHDHLISNILKIVIIAAVLLTAGGCGVDSPVAPSHCFQKVITVPQRPLCPQTPPPYGIRH